MLECGWREASELRGLIYYTRDGLLPFSILVKNPFMVDVRLKDIENMSKICSWSRRYDKRLPIVRKNLRTIMCLRHECPEIMLEIS